MKGMFKTQFVGKKALTYDGLTRYRYVGIGGVENPLQNSFAEEVDDFVVILEEELPVEPGKLYFCVLDCQERKEYREKDIKGGQKITFISLEGEVPERRQSKA